MGMMAGDWSVYACRDTDPRVPETSADYLRTGSCRVGRGRNQSHPPTMGTVSAVSQAWDRKDSITRN